MSFSPILGNPKPQYEDAATGIPSVNGTLTFYGAGGSTPLDTYTDSSGATANDNPITLNSRGEPENAIGGATMIYGNTITPYKVVLKDSAGATVWEIDDVYPGSKVEEWVNSTAAIRTSATTFTVVGDQTSTFIVDRRVKLTGGADRYSTVVSSVFGALTTVTVKDTYTTEIPPFTGSTLHASMDTVYVNVAPQIYIDLIDTTQINKGIALIGNAIQIIDTLTILKSLTGSTARDMWVRGGSTNNDGFQGSFVWDASDLSTEVTLDTQNGVFVPPDSDNTGASGAWVRYGYKDETLKAKWFGVVGDGSTGNATAIAAADAFAQDSIRNLDFGFGDFVIESNIALSGLGITWIGEQDAAWQQGSTLGGAAFIWTGGATPMITITGTHRTFIGFSVENQGTATDFIELGAGGQRLWLEKMSFANGSGHTRFSRSVIRSSGNRAGYSKFEEIACYDPAPIFLDIDGMGIGAGITPIFIGGRSIFDSLNGNDMIVVRVEDEIIDQLIIENCTFNQNDGDLTVVDTTTNPSARTIDVLVFQNNEYDSNVETAGMRMMNLTNVDNIAFNNNHLNGAGTKTALVELVNSNITSCYGNRMNSVNGPTFNADSNSLITIGQNNLNLGNTGGIVNNSAAGVIESTYGTTTYIQGDLRPGNTHVVYRITPTDAVAFTVSFRNGASGFLIPGTVHTIIIRNTTGGGLGAITFAPAYRLAAAVVSPTTGNSFTYTFAWDGTVFNEISRVSAETAN